MKMHALFALAVISGSSALPAHGQTQECLWPGPPEALMDRPSVPDSAMFTIGASNVKVCYSRPSARERVIFGGLVPFGELWRTGANEPTLLHLPFAANVAGADVPAGTYLLFSVPGAEEWTIQLHTSDAPVDEMLADNEEVARGTVPVEALDEHVEMFTIRGTGGDTAGELILEWERTRVRIPIRRAP